MVPDLCSIENLEIPPGQRALVQTGISVKLPEGTYGKISPRSGLAFKQGVDILAGVIDRGCTGELKVILQNHGKYPLMIKSGQAIAQLVIHYIASKIHIEEVTEPLESSDDRGEKGFGSSDQKAAPAPKKKQEKP